MNKNIIAGNWKQMTGDIQKQWGKLTDNDLNQINGDRKKLIGTIQERYGMAQQDAEKQFTDWESSK